jgi:hypothetical protein
MQRKILTAVVAAAMVIGTGASAALAIGRGPSNGADHAGAHQNACSAILTQSAFAPPGEGGKTPNANQLAVFTAAGCISQ